MKLFEVLAVRLGEHSALRGRRPLVVYPDAKP